MAIPLQHLGRRWHMVAGAALLVVTTFGATIQAGILAPQFHSMSGEAVDGSEFDNIQNVSWRSWTVTSVHLANRPSNRALVDGGIVQLSLHEGPVPPDGHVGPALSSLVVGPGQQFNLRLANAERMCSVPLRDLQRNTPFLLPQDNVPALIAVSTPFGSKDIEVLFSVERCRDERAIKSRGEHRLADGGGREEQAARRG